jgi:ribosomal protein S18 acetylase RimI-like enzyme
VISSPRRGEIPQIVDVHMKAFDGFFLTRMGPRFLKLLYSGFCELDGGICLVARDDGQVSGFVAGTTRPSGFFRELLVRRWLQFCLTAATAVMRNPIEVTRRCLPAVFYRGEQPTNLPGRPALLSSLAVLPVCSGRGIGKALVEAFCFEARRSGCDSVYLLTDCTGNDSVNRFYEQCGFKLLDSVRRSGGRKMNRWLMALA